MADDTASTSSSSINNAKRTYPWMDRMQERQAALAGNRVKVQQILEYQRQVTDDERKQATLAGILAASDKYSGGRNGSLPGDEWRARLEASERNTAGNNQNLRGTSLSKQEPNLATATVKAPSSSRQQTVTFHSTVPAEENTNATTAPRGATTTTTASPTIPPSSSPNFFPYSSAEEAQRRTAEARSKAEEEAALRIKLAKDHVAYVEAVHAREDAIRSKSQQTREAALLHEVVAARTECRRHVDEAEMSARNQEDLMKVIAALKTQLEQTTKELEYARKEIDFTGREVQVKKGETTDLRVELALLRKNNEKLEQKLEKRESFIHQLEREKNDVLLDCKKLIRDKQEAEDSMKQMTFEFSEQKKQFEDFRREAAVAPHFRAGAPSPMVFESRRRVSPSQHSREGSSTNNNFTRSSGATTSNSNNQNQNKINTTRSKSPFVGSDNNNNNGGNISQKDLTLLLRDLYADLTSCPLIRRAVCWDTARAGPQNLPIWFDRAMWEQVKRKHLNNEESQQEKKSSSSKNIINNKKSKNQQNDDDDADEREIVPLDYEEYKQKKRESQDQLLLQPKRSGNAIITSNQTTCRRCGHAHHCHHRCSYCSGNNNNNIGIHQQQHNQQERAHVVRTKSPITKSALKKNVDEAEQEQSIVSMNEKNNENDYFLNSAAAAQRRLDKIAAKIDDDGHDFNNKKKMKTENQDNQDDEVSPNSSSSSAQRRGTKNNRNKNREASPASTVTSFGVSRPFKEYVSAADRLAREARRGNRFVGEDDEK